MIGRRLLDIMLREGARIPLDKQQEVIKDFNRAYKEKTLHIIHDGDRIQGFFSYFKEGKDVFVNNLIVYKRFRRKGSLLKVRHFMRNAFKDIDNIFWESKKRKRLAYVK